MIIRFRQFSLELYKKTTSCTSKALMMQAETRSTFPVGCTWASSVLHERMGTNNLYHWRSVCCQRIESYFAFWTEMYLFAYLTQADGVVKCPGPGVEMNSLLDFILTLILARQVIRCCPIPRFICYFSSLRRKSHSFTLCPYPSQEWEVSGSGWEQAALPSECCPESSIYGRGKNNPEPAHSISAQIPYLIGSPDTVPTTSTGSWKSNNINYRNKIARDCIFHS